MKDDAFVAAKPGRDLFHRSGVVPGFGQCRLFGERLPDRRWGIEAFLQPPLEEAIDLFVGFFGRSVPFARSQSHAILVAEQFIDRDGMVERRPSLRQRDGT